MLKVAAFFDLGACTIAVGVYPGTLFREAYSHSERCSGKLIPIANAVPGSLFPQRTLFREAYSHSERCSGKLIPRTDTHLFGNGRNHYWNVGG